eukprot:scaffold22588_cov114-Cylindrotheca_fusiformis.AAC.9
MPTMPMKLPKKENLKENAFSHMTIPVIVSTPKQWWILDFMIVIGSVMKLRTHFGSSTLEIRVFLGYPWNYMFRVENHWIISCPIATNLKRQLNAIIPVIKPFTRISIPVLVS